MPPSLININAYHQPGVEAGKKAAETLLGLQRKVFSVLKNADQPMQLAALAEKAGASDRIEDEKSDSDRAAFVRCLGSAYAD
ncbi:hypothetical protein [Methylomicrobium lacus]|uniref:hypothetical protein n=1 Tax=Methylomicrobium lacus TaxID=136992 RepID=UPI0018E0AC39|nr:hypothetical protein [Methylomicrobium lacus]